jgi:alanyl-tRNA synthetase
MQDLPVTRYDTSYDEAKKMSAIGLFTDKYSDKVSVYQIGLEGNGQANSP